MLQYDWNLWIFCYVKTGQWQKDNKSTQIQRKVVVKGYIHHTNTIKCIFNHVQLTYPVVQGKLLKNMVLTKIYKRREQRKMS